MRLIFKIAGVIVVIGSIVLAKDDYDHIDIYRNGDLVKVRVVYVPSCLSGRHHYYFKFEYNGKIHSKKIGGALCDELQVNQLFTMKSNKERTVFLYVKENPMSEFVAAGFVFLFGIFLIFKKLK